MKIAVYTIAKNEAKHVERWAESAADADYLVILDTGSTDETVELAERAGIIVGRSRRKAFAFDKARNEALALVPQDADWCVSLDMDEILHEGWREELEKSIAAQPAATRFSYKFINNRTPEGEIGQTFSRNLIHRRNGGRWVWPVHEMFQQDDEYVGKTGVIQEHLPDLEKARSYYLPMLEDAAKSMPRDSRMNFYYGRELFYHHQFEAAAIQLKKTLDLKPWSFEESECYMMLAACEIDNAQYWLLRAHAATTDRREPLIALATLARENKKWFAQLGYAMQALDIEEPRVGYIHTPDAWNYIPWDLAALACYMIGHHAAAVALGERALSFAPEHPQLIENLKWYRGEKTNEPE